MATARKRVAAGSAAAIAVTCVGLLVGGSAQAAPRDTTTAHWRYDIGLFGDMPYGATGRAQYPNVLADMNRHRLAFSTFDGDIKNGSDPCVDSVYTDAAASFNRLRSPVVYVPGDNEWTDCDRPAAGGYDPTERLVHLRKVFYPDDQSLGRHTITVTRQPRYPENQRWIYGPVTYIGVDVPGSDNNYPVYDAAGKKVDGDASEALPRNTANLAWLDQGFVAAKAAHSRGVVVVLQADMDFEGLFEVIGQGPTDGFVDTKAALLRLSRGFAGQVLLVNGDSHTLKVDKPLKQSGNLVANFTRVQTFGSAHNHWVRLSIDPSDPELFVVHQQIVAANVAP